MCGRYVVGNECPCADRPKSIWVRENPAAYRAEQDAEEQCKYIWKKQCENHDAIWWPRSHHIRMTFWKLRDEESEIGCFTCEESGRTYCRCECSNCGNKYCPGDYSCPYADRDDEYDEY